MVSGQLFSSFLWFFLVGRLNGVSKDLPEYFFGAHELNI